MSVILLVEDNEDDELLVRRALKKANFACRLDVATDGTQAMAYLFDSGKSCPDLVMLDLKLPKINGLQVLGRIRGNEKTRRIPVVIFTSSDLQSDVIGCFDGGANSFVRKAVDLQEYMIRVAKVVEYWTEINEPGKGAPEPAGVK